MVEFLLIRWNRILLIPSFFCLLFRLLLGDVPFSDTRTVRGAKDVMLPQLSDHSSWSSCYLGWVNGKKRVWTETAVVVYEVVHMGLRPWPYLTPPLQTQGGGGGLEALSLSKWSRCCSRVCALVKKSATCNSDGTYWRAIVCCWQWDRVKEASTPICFVSSCFTGSFAICMAPVLSQRRGVGVSQEIPRSASNHRSHTIYEVVVASARSSAFVLDRDIVDCFLDFHTRGEEPRRIK